MQVGALNGVPRPDQTVSLNDLHRDAMKEIYSHLSGGDLKQFERINKDCESCAMDIWKNFIRVHFPYKFVQMQAFLDQDSEEWIHWGKILDTQRDFFLNKQPAHNQMVNSTLLAVTALFHRTLRISNRADNNSFVAMVLAGTLTASYMLSSITKAYFPVLTNLDPANPLITQSGNILGPIGYHP